MSMRLYPSTTLPIGIDFSERSLKAVQLVRRRGGVRLAALAHIAAPANLITPVGITDLDKASQLLQTLLDKPQYGTFGGTLAVASLPETKTFCVRSLIPLNQGDMAGEVAKVLERHIPYPANQLNYDWEVVGRQSGNADVVIGAVETTVSDAYATCLSAAQLTPAALEIEPIAIARALLPHSHPPQEAVGIVDIGAMRSSFSVHRNGAPLAAVSLPISGLATTNQLAKKLGTTVEKAENAKIVCGLDPACADGVVASALEGMITSLVQKIKETFIFLEEHVPSYQPPQVIFLCGGGAAIKDLHTLLTKRLGIATHPGNVFQNVENPSPAVRKHLQAEVATLKKFSAESIQYQDDSLRFATAIGLALRGVYHTDI